ncbi:MAG: putative acetyl-hydrolase LipR [Luteibacter sp.]|uniref:alpha/beta hydrolase n=1 Tax=Luteibacter sp. TaxID=1886636 RepID=UPI0013846847|nr:alpha/beta hydrolase [Luteibacter sp.]KAF1005497.1 MAG: putative acetyl-hydrolase LipR [Luteibacter sp.]
MPLPSSIQDALARWAASAAPIAGLLKGGSDTNWTQARTMYLDTLAALFPAPPGVTFSRIDLGGVRTTQVVPEHVEAGRTLFYIHGGRYAHGGPDGYHGLAGHYAQRLRATVYLPDYRQAPEHRFPVPIDDTFQAYRGLLAKGVDPSSLAISGDSAGGAMVITIMRRARDAGLALPAGGVAISPWANLTHGGASTRDRDGLDPLCSVEYLELLTRNFLGDTLATDPDASPVFADVRGLPPTLVQIGENEVMLSDAIRLAGHLGENRVRTSLEVWPGMFHVWHLCAGQLPEADQALHNAVTFLEEAFATVQERAERRARAS